MTATAFPTIPESAPFSPKQRAWLNGFFAGLVSTGRVQLNVAPLTAPALSVPPSVASALAQSSILPPIASPEGTPLSWKDVATDDVTRYAWHNAELSIEVRLRLADGRPLDLRMAAALAQLDCGRCGYVGRKHAAHIELGDVT